MHLTLDGREFMSSIAPPERLEPSAFAAAIEEDFRALVEVLSDGAINSQMFDQQVLAQIAAAKSAAERGLQLSQQLVDMTAKGRTESAR